MSRLFWKFFLFFFIAQLTTALAVGAFIQFNANTKANKERIDLSPVSQSLVEAAESTLQFGGVDGMRQLLQSWESQRLKHHVYVIDQNQHDLLDRSIAPKLIKHATKAARNGMNDSVESVTVDGETYLIFVGVKRPDRRAGRLERRPPPESLSPMWRTLTNFPLKALMIAALASALFAAMLAWYFSKPIDRLRRAFTRAAEGDLQFSVASEMGSRSDELSDLGRHFDDMTKRLNALMQSQSRLLHHVSHELRSPLARMQMALGLATQTPAKAANALARIELEAGRMDKLVGELLELSRFESGMVALNKEQFSFNALIDSIVEDVAFEMSDKNIQIVSNVKGVITFDGQLDLLHRAIENVVRNAVKYGPNDSMVNIEVVADQQQLTLRITDQGTGVLAAELENIFKPFIRGHSGSQVEGHGVGLAIAKQVVEAHGGSIAAQNMKTGKIKDSGFCVTLLFPSDCYSILPDK